LKVSVSQEYLACIFKVEKAGQETSYESVPLLAFFHAGFFHGLFLDPEEGGGMFFRNVY
jgi:hypothetical protein